MQEGKKHFERRQWRLQEIVGKKPNKKHSAVVTGLVVIGLQKHAKKKKKKNVSPANSLPCLPNRRFAWDSTEDCLHFDLQVKTKQNKNNKNKKTKKRVGANCGKEKKSH